MKQLSVCCVLMLLFFTGEIFALPISSANSGNWNSPATWTGGIVPSAGDVVTISNGHTVSVTANASCISLTIGSGSLNSNTSLQVTGTVSLTVSANITIMPPAGGTTDNTLDAGDGTVTCYSLITINSGSNSRRCIITINDGTLDCQADCQLASNANRNKITFTGNGNLMIGGTASSIVSGQFTAGNGTVVYTAGGDQDILHLNYYSLTCTGSGSKTLSANITVQGNLLIAGMARLDAGVSNRTLTVGGDWSVTSTDADPFVEEAGKVIFNGSSGTQLISTILGTETFYNLTINNSSGNSPGISCISNISVLQSYSHSAGVLDLSGKSITVNSQNNTGTFITCPLTGGAIISSTAGASVSFTNSNDSTYVNIDGFSIGDNNNSVYLYIKTGRVNIERLVLYGNGDFTKTAPIDDASAQGGNSYHGNVSFTATSTASRWRMGSGTGAQADSFFAKAVFNAYANGGSNNNFIIGANSTGNYYADSVWLTSTTVGGLFIGRQNGAVSGTASSHFFNGHVEVMVTYSGNVNFADGKDTLPSSVTFNKTLRLNSTNTSTGDIYVGKNSGGSTITFTNTAQLTDGSITGATNIYFYNVTQNGFYLQSTTNAGISNSTIQIGSNSSPCVWNGPVAFTAPNLNIAYSSFNGFINIFTMNGDSVGQNCTGGNTFASYTHNLFTNAGAANWNLANNAPDAYNGNVYFSQLSTGLLRPSYNTNCTYGGNIYIQAGSDSIAFASGANGRVTITGSYSTLFDNSTSRGTSIKRLTINKSAGNFTLNKGICINSGGDLTLLSGKLISSSTHLLRLLSQQCTVTATNSTSTSYVDGPIQIDVSSATPQTLHFPIGKGNDCRPVDLVVTHSSATPYSYVAELFNASAQALGWTRPFPIAQVSSVHYWDVNRYNTASGIAEPSNELAGNATITLYYDSNDNITDPTQLRVCKNTSVAPTFWINTGGSGATTAPGKVSSTSTPDAFNSFSRFTLGYSGTPLPPAGFDSSRCGDGNVILIAHAAAGEAVDWYADSTGGSALAIATDTFQTPVLSTSTIFYAAARNANGFVSDSRTPVSATIYHTATINAFSPTAGGTGTILTISGSGFNTVTGVTVGGIPVTAFSIDSDTTLTATLAPGISGYIALTNTCGTDSLGIFNFIYVTTWTGAADNSWVNPVNWDNGVPDSLFSTVIPPAANTPLISSNQAIKTLSLLAGASLDIAVANTLSVLDSVANNGTIIGAGTVSLTGATQQFISGQGSFYNLQLNNSNGAQVSSDINTLIDITGRLTPTSGTLVTNDHLVLKSDAGGTATIGTGPSSGNYITGKIMLERFIPAHRSWRLISFPLNAAGAPTINEALQENAGGNELYNPSPGYGTHITGGAASSGFDQNPVNNTSMKELVGNSLIAIGSTNQSIAASDAWFLFVRGSRANNLALLTNAPADNTTLRAKGNVKQGDQSWYVSGSGWKLVANPFASRIDLNAIAAGNSAVINRNFVFWDPKLGGSNNVGGYVTASYNGSSYDYSPTPVSSLSEFAQPFTAFYVDAVATGNIAVAETDKCNCGNDNVFRPAEPASSIRVNLLTQNGDGSIPVVDGTLAIFGTQTGQVKKLVNPLAENIGIHTTAGLSAIDRRKSLGNSDSIQLQLGNLTARKYELETFIDHFDSTGLTATLYDRYLGQQTSLPLTERYILEFAVTGEQASAAANRFYIILKRTIKNLPVVVENLTATILRNPVNSIAEATRLDWTISNSSQLESFDVERSADGTVFSNIHHSDSVANSATAAYYSFDLHPMKGLNVYRIRANFRIGGESYSKLVTVIFSNQSGIRLLQNPVTNRSLQLAFSNQPAGMYKLLLFDQKGMQLEKTVLFHDGADAVKMVSFKNFLPAGIYHVRVLEPNNQVTVLNVSIR